MSEFYRTRTGQKFFEKDVPNFLEQIKRLNDNLETQNLQKSKEIELNLSERDGMKLLEKTKDYYEQNLKILKELILTSDDKMTSSIYESMQEDTRKLFELCKVLIEGIDLI